METNEIKQLWQDLNRKLEAQSDLGLKQVQVTQLKKARHALWPLLVGQVLQMLAGVALILLGIAAWQPYNDVPHVFVAGIVIHVYGIMIVALGGLVIGRIRSIDYAAPVSQIQLQLATLRLLHIRAGMLVGLPWWALWIPFMMVLLAVVLGVDMYVHMETVLNLSLAFGVLGLLATWAFRRWVRHPSRESLRNRLDDRAAGRSLQNARRAVEDIHQFTREEEPENKES